MAPEHVRLDEVDEDEALVDLAQEPLGLLNPLDVRLRRVGLVDVATREDVADLADAVHLLAGLAHERQVVRPARLEREVVPVRRPDVVARLARERPGDHAADGVLAREDLARRAAAVVELLQRDRVLVRGDLEDRVRGRVDDPLPRPLVLLPQLLDDVRAGRGLVSQHAAGGLVHERVDHVVREAVRIGRKCLRGDDPHVLPVARRRVLPLRALEEPAGDCRCAWLRRASLERLDVAEAERLETRQVEPADGSGDVSERVRPFVPVLRRRPAARRHRRHRAR